MKVGVEDPFEVEATRVVQEWLGPRGTVTAQGGHAEDFFLDYADGRVGIGEVKRVTDEAYQRMWQALHRLSPPQHISLDDGLGRWGASISVGTPLNGLGAHLNEIAIWLLGAGLSEAQIQGDWPQGYPYDRLRELRITRFWRSGGPGPGSVLLLHEGVWGPIPLDADALIPWIQEYLDQNKRSLRNSLARLQASVADERHLFLWLEDGMPDELLLFLNFHPERHPQSGPPLPSYVSHLWLGVPHSFSEERWVWLYRRDQGWSAFPVSS